MRIHFKFGVVEPLVRVCLNRMEEGMRNMNIYLILFLI